MIFKNVQGTESFVECTPTNGDMIRALFPNGKVIETEDGDIGYEIYIDKNYSFCSWFDGTWWNAPYKKEVK